jgi:membrane-bound lytic murein transglycosylase D
MILNLLNSYLTFNFLLIVLYVVFKNIKGVNFREKLRLQYAGLLLALGMVLLQPLFPKHQYIIPALKVWSAQAPQLKLESIKEVTETSFITISSEVSAPRIRTTILFQILGALLTMLLLWGLARVLRELFLLKKLEHDSLLIKQRQRVQVFISDKVNIPFSYFKPGKLVTMLPSALAGDSKDFEVALYHEFQHHRQGDTFWAYPLLLLKNLCILNPFSHLFVNLLHETQEFACDEALLSQAKVDTDSYISCLIKVAQTSVETYSEPVCATGFCFRRQQNILKRRIEKMNDKKCVPTKRSLIRFATFSMVCLLAFSAWASRNLVQDRKITMSEAQELIKSQGDFPLIVNDDVLVQLNKYLGTPEGRTFIKDSLKRKNGFAKILKDKSDAYGTPAELNAIPIVESGFINRTSTGRIKAAGLWMFIPGTARRYGMTVNKTVDERLNVEKETDAAQRYLLANHVLFKDWHLSLLAYNIGEGAVQKGIKKFNTRSAWELVANGVEGDKNYLPSVMAAMIIMRNPELLEN